MITAADARAWLGVGSEHDRRLERLIEEATAALGHELRRYLGPPKAQVDIRCGGDYPGHREAFLSDDPQISEATPMTVATRATVFEPFVDLDPEDWALVGLQVLARNRFPPGRGTVRLSYTVGYPVETGPAELRDLVRQLVVLKFGAKPQDASGLLMQSETMGDYSYTRGDVEALAGWNSIVNRWRRRLV
jgi:hypothetical protein